MMEAFALLDRSVPIGIGKQAGNATEVHNHKVRFALFFAQACPTSDNLLEFGHRADHLIKDNQFDHFAVRTRGKEF